MSISSGWQIAEVRSASNWREFSTTGQQIVQESGTLVGIAVTGTYQCDSWTLGALVGELQGARRYEGQTNTGVAALSSAVVALHPFQEETKGLENLARKHERESRRGNASGVHRNIEND